jgi:hypothetical protein
MEEWLAEDGEYLSETDSEEAQARLFDRTATWGSDIIRASD